MSWPTWRSTGTRTSCWVGCHDTTPTADHDAPHGRRREDALSDYSYYVQPQMDDAYGTLFELVELWKVERDPEKKSVLKDAIVANCHNLEEFYWKGTNPQGFSVRTVKASKTKIQRIQGILEQVEP